MVNFILVDTARLELPLEDQKFLNEEYLYLPIEESGDQIKEISPLIFRFSANSKFCEWFYLNCWGGFCGVLISAKTFSIYDLFGHFKNFLTIQTEDNEVLYFRFYDPRVLKIFLPTCDQNQLLEFFGPIESFICEGDTKEEAIRFWHQNGTLMQEVLTVEQVFGKTIQNVEI